MSGYVLKSLNNGSSFKFNDGDVIVGRDEACDITVDDTVLSRKHLCITVDDQGVWAEDLGSTNGSRLNYAILRQKSALKHGDVLSLGEQEFQIQFPNAAPITLLRRPQAAGQNSFIAIDDNDGATLLRQNFALPAAWSEQDRNLFASHHGEVSETDILSLLKQPLTEKPKAVAALILLPKDSKKSVALLSANKDNRWHIGRSSDNTIVLESSTISQQHASLVQQGKTWMLVDKNSRNGIKINRKRVQEGMVKHNDIIEIGDLRCIFRVL